MGCDGDVVGRGDGAEFVPHGGGIDLGGLNRGGSASLPEPVLGPRLLGFLAATARELLPVGVWGRRIQKNHTRNHVEVGVGVCIGSRWDGHEIDGPLEDERAKAKTDQHDRDSAKVDRVGCPLLDDASNQVLGPLGQVLPWRRDFLNPSVRVAHDAGALNFARQHVEIAQPVDASFQSLV